MTQTTVFNPTLAEVTSIVESAKGLTISGVADKPGYEAVFAAQQELKGLRVAITKFGKGAREEALAWQKEVIRQEKELLAVIEPVENALKEERSKVDEAKKREERIVLLPSRKNMLEGILVTMSDDEILALDEKEFAEMFNEKKMAYLEAENKKRLEAEAETKRKEELEKAKAEAAEKAVADERARAEREAQAEKDRLAKIEQEKLDEEARVKQTEADKIAEEKKELAKMKRKKAYQEFLEKNGYTSGASDEFYIKQDGNTFTIYKKLDEITIE